MTGEERMEDMRIDGWSGEELAAALELPGVNVLHETTSTLDVAHRLGADGAKSGTLVIADRQTAGRGRGGNKWESPAGSGLWITIIERPLDASGMDVLSLRVGLLAARALDRFSADPVRLKWPNDLHVDGRKLGGILIEARWQEGELEWVAIGVGVNVLAPIHFAGGTGLEAGTRRMDVLFDLVPAVRTAGSYRGELGSDELAEWRSRDMARGHGCSEPARGTVMGINASGELLVAIADSVARFRSGSLVLDPLT